MILGLGMEGPGPLYKVYMGLIIKGPAPHHFPHRKYMEIHCQNFHASFDGAGENNILKTSTFRDFSSLNFSFGEKRETVYGIL